MEGKEDRVERDMGKILPVGMEGREGVDVVWIG